MKTFNRLSCINSIKELFGFRLYFDGENYFYAWDAKSALKKKTKRPLYIINDYGRKIQLGEGT